MERSRITPRLRPRPYDLRRKVLLKNFFREQMTHIPNLRSTVETSLNANIDSDSVESESNTSEGNILTPKKVHDNIETPKALPEPTPSTSNCCEKENSNNQEILSAETSSKSDVDERPRSKFSRLSRIIETIDSRLPKKNRRKGITKAKHELGSTGKILKPAGRQKMKDTKNSGRERAKSFFDRFKSRRDEKRKKLPSSKITNLFGSRNSSSPKKDSKVSTTTTQSVQTEVSWSPDYYERMVQSNMSLIEENRLLSESLTSIINHSDYRAKSIQNSCCTDSYANSNSNSTPYYPSQKPFTQAKNNTADVQHFNFSRTRILRSKSMQTKNEKRSQASRPRTRSFNSRYTRPFDNDYFVSNKNKSCSQGYYRVNLNCSPISNNFKTRPSALQSIDVMPLYKTNTSSLLQTFPSKSGKDLIRRSSMPKRPVNWNNNVIRPTRSASMRERNNSYLMERQPCPNQPSYHRRSTTFDGYSRSVPFQDLPSSAFY